MALKFNRPPSHFPASLQFALIGILNASSALPPLRGTLSVVNSTDFSSLSRLPPGFVRMGPPSRYNLYTSAHSRLQSSQASVPMENGIDTASLSNTELAKHFLKLFATAATLEEFSSGAANAFSRHVNITVNGVHLSRDLYAQQWGAAFGAAGTISFGGAMETPNVRIPMFQSAALVGIMYEANFSTSADRQGAGDRSTTQISIPVSSTINIIIAEDKTLPSSCVDRRRVVSVNQVLVDKDGLLTFPLRNL